MPDIMNPLAPGEQTSEFWLTKVLTVAGGVVTAIGASLASLQQAFPDSKWIGAALMVVGTLTSVLTALGYIRGRSLVKAAAITTDTPPMGILPGGQLAAPRPPAPSL